MRCPSASVAACLIIQLSCFKKDAHSTMTYFSPRMTNVGITSLQKAVLHKPSIPLALACHPCDNAFEQRLACVVFAKHTNRPVSATMQRHLYSISPLIPVSSHLVVAMLNPVPDAISNSLEGVSCHLDRTLILARDRAKLLDRPVNLVSQRVLRHYARRAGCESQVPVGFVFSDREEHYLPRAPRRVLRPIRPAPAAFARP